MSSFEGVTSSSAAVPAREPFDDLTARASLAGAWTACSCWASRRARRYDSSASRRPARRHRQRQLRLRHGYVNHNVRISAAINADSIPRGTLSLAAAGRRHTCTRTHARSCCSIATRDRGQVQLRTVAPKGSTMYALVRAREHSRRRRRGKP